VPVTRTNGARRHDGPIQLPTSSIKCQSRCGCQCHSARHRDAPSSTFGDVRNRGCSPVPVPDFNLKLPAWAARGQTEDAPPSPGPGPAGFKFRAPSGPGVCGARLGKSANAAPTVCQCHVLTCTKQPEPRVITSPYSGCEGCPLKTRSRAGPGGAWDDSDATGSLSAAYHSSLSSRFPTPTVTPDGNARGRQARLG
jgi:hypothetical protein